MNNPTSFKALQEKNDGKWSRINELGALMLFWKDSNFVGIDFQFGRYPAQFLSSASGKEIAWVGLLALALRCCRQKPLLALGS